MTRALPSEWILRIVFPQLATIYEVCLNGALFFLILSYFSSRELFKFCSEAIPPPQKKSADTQLLFSFRYFIRSRLLFHPSVFFLFSSYLVVDYPPSDHSFFKQQQCFRTDWKFRFCILL